VQRRDATELLNLHDGKIADADCADLALLEQRTSLRSLGIADADLGETR
jgi:hypothetical protein